MRYNNYHKHTDYSNIFSPDTYIKIDDYLKRSVELGHTTYFTIEHGYGGSIFESKKLCNKYNIKCIFGIEGYIVENPLEKDSSNYHIVIIPKTNIARKKLNKANSHANKEGFYYKPRLFLDDLLAFKKDELFITTACCGGLLKDDNSYEKILLPLIMHFKDNILIEVQTHIDESQKIINKRAIEVSEKYNLKLIAANDSHYIYPNDKHNRADFLKGKNINYGFEDEFMLDYPSYETMTERFIRQGILSKKQISQAIHNTLILDECEEIEIDKTIKMPNIHKELNINKRHQKLKQVIIENFKEVIKKDGITKEEIPMYKKAILDEFKVIEETAEVKTVDYFLFNYENIKLAKSKYGGVLTKSGRGSAGGEYINRILDLTEIDRLKTDIPLYPERYISTARALENRSIADCDFNTADQEPFFKASRELLGENGCEWMIAYGTLQEAEAFRNTCRAKDYKFEEFNEVGKDLSRIKKGDIWESIFEESRKYVNTIVSASVHPCSCLLFDGDIESEIGVVKVGKHICTTITSSEADDWKYLKNDYLKVSVWEIIAKVFNKIGKPIMPLKELLENLDNKVWDIFKNGLTCTVNQTDSDWGTHLVKEYRPQSVEDLSKFVAAIRPSFDSWRDSFIAREKYSTGVYELDEVLKSTDHYILFQENLMQYFVWLGISPADSIGLIKKISKKKIEQEDFDKLTTGLKENWIKNTGSDYLFDETWEMVQSCIAYGFCSAHAYAVAIDACYGAYLKSHHPMEYYEVVLSMYADDAYRTRKLIDELKYFNIELKGIKFGESLSEYRVNKQNNAIYKGISSIKYCNDKIASELFKVAQENKFSSFVDVVHAIKTQTSVDYRALKILAILNFFVEYGKNKKLCQIIKLYEELYDRKQISIKDLDKFEKKLNIKMNIIYKYCGRQTEKTLMDLDMDGFIKEVSSLIEDKSFSIKEQCKYELEYLEYVTCINENVSDSYYIVTDFKVYKDKTKPYLELYQLNSGDSIKTKVAAGLKFSHNPFEKFSILNATLRDRPKRKLINGELVKTSEMEQVLEDWEVY